MNEKSKPIPLYYQGYEIFLNKIMTGEWPENSRIPCEMDLCRTYGMSRITIRQALAQLKSENYLVSHQGKGTFVRSRQMEEGLNAFYSFSDQASAAGRRPKSVILDFSTMRAGKQLAGKLHISARNFVYRIVRLRCIDTKPFVHEISYVPVSLVPDLTKESIAEYGLYHSMRLLGQCDPDAAAETFCAIPMMPELAEYLHCDPHMPALQIERVASSRGVTVEYCYSVARGDSIRYQVTLKKQL